jgi:hypothetical protein
LDDSLERFLQIISPAFEKILSEGQLVAGMQTYLLTRRYKFGYLNLFCCHHLIESMVSVTASLKYESISTLQTFDKLLSGFSSCCSFIN